MALFDSFKKKGEAAPKAATKKVSTKKDAPKSVKAEVTAKPEVKKPALTTAGKRGGIDLSQVITRPRITEKATMLAERGAYVFDVHQSSDKSMIARAVKAKFGVTPEKVSIINIPGKRKQSRTTGTMHAMPGSRKAVVYLKKGEKIEFV